MGSGFSIAERARDRVADGTAMLSDAVGQLGRDLATFDLVEERLVEAWGYLMRMPDRERGWQRLKAMWPDVRRHHAFGDYGDMEPDARPSRPGLRTAEVDRMEEALGWVAWVPQRDRKMVGFVLAQLQCVPRPEWADIARQMCGDLSADGYRKRYGRAITGICKRLNTAEIRR